MVVVGATVVVVVGAIVVVVVVVVGIVDVVVGHHHHHVVVVGATVDVTGAWVVAVVAGAGAVVLAAVLAAAVLTGAGVVATRAVVLLEGRAAVELGRLVWVVVAPAVPDVVAALEGAFVTSTPSTWTPTTVVVGTEPRLPTFTVSGRCGRNATRPTTTAASSASASNTRARWRGSGDSRIGTAPIVAVGASATADSGPAQPTGSSTRSV